MIQEAQEPLPGVFEISHAEAKKEFADRIVDEMESSDDIGSVAGCAVKPVLEYDVLTEWWTCPGKDCGKSFQFLITTSRNAPSISAVTCPGCGERLNYYVDRTAWECRNCGRTYLSFAELDRDRK